MAEPFHPFQSRQYPKYRVGPGRNLLIYEGNYFARAQRARKQKGKLITLDVFRSQTVYSDAKASSSSATDLVML